MRSRSRPLFGISLIAMVALPLVIGGIRVTGRVIVPEGEIVTEDLYAVADLVSIEGTVQGDVFAVTGELRITGTVDGDVIALVGGPTTVEGTVTGAVRVAGVRLDIPGRVGDDLAALAIEAKLGGTIGRDVLMLGGEVDVPGTVGRDIRLQALRFSVGGEIGRDVLVRVDSMTLDSGAAVSGDVLYQSSADARVSDDVVIGGQFTRRDVIAPVWAKAVGRVVSVLSLFALVVSGLAALWLFPASSGRAIVIAGERPWRAAAVGLGLVIALPLVALPLFLTLVGIPVALFVLMAWALALVLGPIPAVTRFGTLVTGDRSSAAVALVAGAVVWRGAMWVLPLIAGLVYVAALSVGLGAYAIAGWGLRGRVSA